MELYNLLITDREYNVVDNVLCNLEVRRWWKLCGGDLDLIGIGTLVRMKM